ncbi:hypothetical protein QQP08_018366 [Theobroma cacao]|nr:hypothetical protein QQP08_018366 [Theobroma cacao]
MALIGEWKKYPCQVSASGICITKGRLNPVFYDQMTTVVNVNYALHYHASFLVDIEDCTFVREIVSSITKDYCPTLKRSSEIISIGLVILSTEVMFSVTLWLFYARRRRHREYTKYDTATFSQDQLGGEKSI